jgi:hypothetical protein
MQHSSVRLRAVQIAISFAYTLVLTLALAASPEPKWLLIALTMMGGAYATGRVLPDVRHPVATVHRLCGLAIIVLLASILTLVTQGNHGLAVVITAYCAGNRFRAAGLGVRSV